jgi:hypothetical protein
LTLIEVLISAVILIVVMFWLTQYYVQGRKHLDYEEHRRKATALAQARLDEVRGWSYDSLISFMDSTVVDTLMNVDGREYTVSLILSPGPNPHSTVVSAVVEWEAALSYESSNTFPRRDTTTTIIGRPL